MNRCVRYAAIALMTTLALQSASSFAQSNSTGTIRSQSRPMAPANPSMPFTAVVSQSASTFSFPYPPASRFEWCSGGKQYGFEVNARARSTEYEFGFSLFGPMGATPCERGNLQALLNAGQTGAFQVQGDSGDMVPNSDRNITVRPDAQKRLLIMNVTGAAILRRIFANRPEFVEFKITTPRGEQKRRVRVQYMR